MTPDERTAIEQRAERALRRGELSEAFSLLQQVAQAFPDDGTVAQRLEQLKENLQPAELMNPKSNFRSEPTGPAKSAVDEAERLADKGDFAGAIATYRKVLAEKPESELVQERLGELLALAQARATHRPARQDKMLVLSELLSRVEGRRRKS